MKYIAHSIKTNADLQTPVGLFYKLRQQYSEVLLLESSDYSSKEDSLSFLLFDLMEGMEVMHDQFITVSDGNKVSTPVDDFVNQFQKFISSFDIEHDDNSAKFAGIFGYSSFDAVKYFDKNIYNLDKPSYTTPTVKYGLYKYMIVVDHFKDEMYIIEMLKSGEASQIENIQKIIINGKFQQFDFMLEGEVTSNMEDQTFRDIVTKCKEHIQRGDVFQIVPSRRFEQKYSGDEFNVYRKLRSINPSPYLFYFDYGSFTIFGSSPEAQMIVKNRVAEIHPIAGTVKRTGDIEADKISAQELLNNPKENAEHIMLVDLARNDLSKNTQDVKVVKYCELQQFSHVFHLVSIVNGIIKEGVSSYQIFADTFPAGTLSGAPKHMAINLIDRFEPTKRGYYGGGIGGIMFNGNFIHAIMIRSFMATQNTLYFQAGAGVVIDSTEEGELQEVNNKLAALRKALEIANKN
jgi:anthranilate synthase component I